MNEYSVLVIFFLKLASNHPRLQQKRERVKKYIIHHLQETRTMSTPTLTCDDVRRFQTKRRRCQRRRRRRRRRRRCQDARAVITNFRRQQKRRYFWQKTKLIKSRLV